LDFRSDHSVIKRPASSKAGLCFSDLRLISMADAKASKDIRLKRLNPSDDPRTQLSKLISWILRRGAAEAGVKQDPQTKWVTFKDLCAADVLKEHTSESLWQIIVDFNGRMDGKGPRYEINDGAGGPFIRAYTREQRTVLQDAPVAVQTKDGNQNAGAAAQAMNPMSPYMNPMMMMYQASMSNYMWQQAVAAQGKYMGVVKSLNLDKGFGFIDCQQTKLQYDRDVFLTRQQLTSLSGLQVGTCVSFEVEVNKQGMPQAKNVSISGYGMPMAYSGANNKGKGKGGKDKGKGKGKGKDGEGKKGKGKGKEGKKKDKEAEAKEKKEREKANAANTDFISAIALGMK